MPDTTSSNEGYFNRRDKIGLIFAALGAACVLVPGSFSTGILGKKESIPTQEVQACIATTDKEPAQYHIARCLEETRGMALMTIGCNPGSSHSEWDCVAKTTYDRWWRGGWNRENQDVESGGDAT